MVVYAMSHYHFTQWIHVHCEEARAKNRSLGNSILKFSFLREGTANTDPLDTVRKLTGKPSQLFSIDSEAILQSFKQNVVVNGVESSA